MKFVVNLAVLNFIVCVANCLSYNIVITCLITGIGSLGLISPSSFSSYDSWLLLMNRWIIKANMPYLIWSLMQLICSIYHLSAYHFRSYCVPLSSQAFKPARSSLSNHLSSPLTLCVLTSEDAALDLPLFLSYLSSNWTLKCRLPPTLHHQRSLTTFSPAVRPDIKPYACGFKSYIAIDKLTQCISIHYWSYMLLMLPCGLNELPQQLIQTTAIACSCHKCCTVSICSSIIDTRWILLLFFATYPLSHCPHTLSTAYHQTHWQIRI